MKEWKERLQLIEKHIGQDHITVMIMGLGSVGTYLLDYLAGLNDASLTIVVAGRDGRKMASNINIVRVAASIRGQLKSPIYLESGVDFNDVEAMARCMERWKPDFIVNSSRVYSGLKYGSISWSHVRAYGIWAPLAMKYIKNIMEASRMAEAKGVVINTSYSDAVIPWLKSAGRPYPDFGSGNGNHLIPRLRFAAAQELGIRDFWNIEVALATSHFHDVVISKEGHAEGILQLMRLSYRGEELEVSQDRLFSLCKIPMPVDARRNMMNASSNYEIILSMIRAGRNGSREHFFSPGVSGEIGGYPVAVDGRNGHLETGIDTSVFTMEEMREANRKSIYLDGIERVEGGCLVYTDELREKVKRAFGETLPKSVDFDEADRTAEFLIQKIIKPQLSRGDL